MQKVLINTLSNPLNFLLSKLFIADNALFSYRHKVRTIIRVLILYSAAQGFWFFADLYDYKPWFFRIKKGISRATEMHLGLWLATLELRSRWRFLVALLFIPPAVGTYFILWHFNNLTIFIGLLFFAWLFYKVIRGQPLDG